ncbi:MAG TPA: hypothetical protein PKY77_09570 [Phycisphaerae bacterium]|nr:hypothetical protein [Phycisphaerae bacterium]HRY69858.1 hypothetical protein [Phycisphaerae bacterium]HSA25415.1 hypothetical protein [Phycisphaerae bacterium]
MRTVTRIIAILMTGGTVIPAFAQIDTAAAENKLLSMRAAQADAYRKLAEAIKGLKITSDTYVKDFVAESDSIQAAMDTFIRGVKLGQPRWLSDQSCEVPAEVTVSRVIQEIKEVHTRHYKGDRIKGHDIEHMNQQVRTEVIKVIGTGAPRPDLPPNLPAGVEQVIEKGPPPPPTPPFPPLWQKLGPQARMMAVRTARLVALRNLAERIGGLRVTSNTLVRDFVAQSDEITAVTEQMLVGFKVTREYLHSSEPIAEVTIEVPMESVINVIKELHSRSIQGDRIKGTDVTEVTKQIQGQVFEASGMGIPPPQYVKQAEAVLQTTYPPWATEWITMDGQGMAPNDKRGTPQGRLLAARAAELEAKRKLAEHVMGLHIESNVVVKDFIARHDEIRSSVDAVIVNSRVERTTFDGDMATVTVVVPGMQVWELIDGRIRAGQGG